MSLGIAQSAYALFTVNARPYDGGFDLRFDKISPLTPTDTEKEVTITVNTDINTQYQVVQMLTQPLTNAEGAMIPSRAFSVYTLRGSNQRGTMRIDSEVPVTPSRILVYTSNTAGDNDSFIIVYRIHPSLVSDSGYYRGRITFLLEPINSTERPHSVVLDVEADIEVESKVEINTITGSRTIQLRSPEAVGMPMKVFVSVQGQQQGQYRIMQTLEPPVSHQGLPLEEGITFYVASKEGGTPAQSSEGQLRQGQSLVYTSDAMGSGDEIEITYGLSDALDAGNYRGSIRYDIENLYSANMRGGLIDTLTLEVDVEVVFELKALPEGGGSISFRNIKEGETRTVTVLVEVTSNLAKPYQITQFLSQQLTSKDGQAIPKDSFKFYTEGIDEAGMVKTKGLVKYPDKTGVSTEETTIFISNRDGASDSFKVVYELIGPRDQWGGDYNAGIHYSLSQIEIQ